MTPDIQEEAYVIAQICLRPFYSNTITIIEHTRTKRAMEIIASALQAAADKARRESYEDGYKLGYMEGNNKR